jgi:nicotinamide-nucleotide amidase
MNAEIITIGDELLIGMTVDSNSTWMANELTAIGINVYQITSISDSKEHISKVIDKALQRSELVLLTGGLGPTNDDITKNVLSEYFDSELIFNQQVFSSIETLLNARGLQMNNNNRMQAEVPACCEVLLNSKGTAPGMWFEKDGSILVSMPGVPYEMKHLMEDHVIPKVKRYFKRPSIYYRLIMTYGTFEAKLAEILADFEKELPEFINLAYLPTAGIIKLRLTGRGNKLKLLEDEINKQIDKLYSIIPQFIYGLDNISLEEEVGRLLKEKGLTVSTAESCTGGNIARMITSIPGSSSYFTGSIIAYDNSIKQNELLVNESDIASYGAVSEQVIIQMAEGIRSKFHTDFGIATSGIAGPDGGTEDKPVGTVWIAISSASGILVRKFAFSRYRDHNIRRSSLAALGMLRTQIIRS